MKNFKNYLLTALLALTLAFGITGITTLTKASAETKLKANLNVGQDISLVISADIPNAGTVTATFAWNGEKGNYSDTVVGEKQGETDTYKFFYRGLSAQYMAKEVEVTVKNGETEVDKATVSVMGILNTYQSASAKALKINANAYKKLTTLSADILNYGKAAEKYLNMADDIGTVTGGTTFVADDTATSNETGNLKWNAGIAFDYNLRPAVKVYIPAETYKDTLVAKIDNKAATLTATPTANVYTLTYSNYNILDIDKDYKFEIFDGETSLGSYTSSLAALAKESNAEIVKAAYTYGKSVVKYAFVLDDINFVSEHIQAENAIIGLEAQYKKTGSSWQYTAADGTIAKGSGTVANGAEGKYIENLSYNGNDLLSDRWNIALNVMVPKAGEYDLRAMMQINNIMNLKGKLKFAVKQSGDEVTESDYARSDTTDYCYPASRWSDDKYTGNWTNTFFWTDVSLATVTLEEGENTIYIVADSATTRDIPNIDYFYIKGFTTKEDEIVITNARNTFTVNLDEQPIIGKTEETAFLIQKGVALKELYNKDGKGYVNGMTGLYMIIPGYVIDGHVETYKVPVTESMISGLNVHESGIQIATITYGKYSAEVYFNVFGATVEAEDNVYMLEDGKETDNQYKKVQSNTITEYYDNDGKLNRNIRLYNGFSGRGMVTNLDEKVPGTEIQNYKLIYFKFTVIVPETGKYNLNIRAQYINSNQDIKNKFGINVNGQTDESGNLVFNKNNIAQIVNCGNQLSKYCTLPTGQTNYAGYYNMFWWSNCRLGTFELNKGENVIRIRIPSEVKANIDSFEVTYADSASNSQKDTATIFSMRTKGVKDDLTGKVLTIKKGEKLTDILNVPGAHPATYTSLYIHTSTGKDIPILGSMLEGKVDYNKTGEQTVTVTDPVSGESASFKLLIKA